jgi:hypothetical protein
MPTPRAGWRLAWPSVKRAPDAEDKLVEALQAGQPARTVDAALDDLLASSSSSTTTAPRLDPQPWVVAHTRGPLTWRLFTLSGRGKALASQAIDTASSSVVSRAESFGGALLSTAVGTLAPRADDPATFDVYVTGAEVAVGAGVDGAGVMKEDTTIKTTTTPAGAPRGWSLRLPISGKGTFRVEYAGRRLRVFRGSGGLAVQVRPGVL